MYSALFYHNSKFYSLRSKAKPSISPCLGSRTWKKFCGIECIPEVYKGSSVNPDELIKQVWPICEGKGSDEMKDPGTLVLRGPVGLPLSFSKYGVE